MARRGCACLPALLAVLFVLTVQMPIVTHFYNSGGLNGGKDASCALHFSAAVFVFLTIIQLFCL